MMTKCQLWSFCLIALLAVASSAMAYLPNGIYVEVYKGEGSTPACTSVTNAWDQNNDSTYVDVTGDQPGWLPLHVGRFAHDAQGVGTEVPKDHFFKVKAWKMYGESYWACNYGSQFYYNGHEQIVKQCHLELYGGSK